MSAEQFVKCPLLNMTCADCGVCLQLCPGASASDNYTVSHPRLELLQKRQRLIELAVFLEFRLAFCPTAHRWVTVGVGSGRREVSGQETEEERANEGDVTCSKSKPSFSGLSYFTWMEQQTGPWLPQKYIRWNVAAFVGGPLSKKKWSSCKTK